MRSKRFKNNKSPDKPLAIFALHTWSIMKRILFILFAIGVFSTQALCQKNKSKTLTDNGKEYIYTRENGVTESYINYFGAGFKFPLLETIKGEVLNEGFYKGKTVVINFWFIACMPCVAEMPSLNKLYDKYQSDSIAFIGISFDDTAKINNFLERFDFKFKLASYPRDLTQQIKRVVYYPLTMIVDKHSIIRYVIFGTPEGKKQSEEIFDLLDKALSNILYRPVSSSQ